jgi:hypothetical protein
MELGRTAELAHANTAIRSNSVLWELLQWSYGAILARKWGNNSYYGFIALGINISKPSFESCGRRKRAL